MIRIVAPVVALILCAAPVTAGQNSSFRGSAKPMDQYLAAEGAARGLRKDAADGTGAPRIGRNPSYPKSLRDWLAVKAKYPEQSARFQPCTDELIQATNLIRKAGAYMTPNQRLTDDDVRQINALTKQASDLIQQADTCIQGVKPPSAPLQGGVTENQPGAGNPSAGNYGSQTPAPDQPPGIPSGVGPIVGGVTGGGFGGPADGSSGGASGPPFPYVPPNANDPYRNVPGYIPGGYNPCANPAPPAGCPHLPFEQPAQAQAAPQQPIRIGISEDHTWAPWVDNLKRLIDERRHALLVKAPPASKRQWEYENVRARASFTIYSDGRIAVQQIQTAAGDSTDPSYARLVNRILTTIDPHAIGPFPVQVNSIPLTWDFSEQLAKQPVRRAR